MCGFEQGQSQPMQLEFGLALRENVALDGFLSFFLPVGQNRWRHCLIIFFYQVKDNIIWVIHFNSKKIKWAATKTCTTSMKGTAEERSAWERYLNLAGEVPHRSGSWDAGISYTYIYIYAHISIHIICIYIYKMDRSMYICIYIYT